MYKYYNLIIVTKVNKVVLLLIKNSNVNLHRQQGKKCKKGKKDHKRRTLFLSKILNNK